MQVRVMAAAFSFCIFSLGLFLGAGVRPLLMLAGKSEPGLIGPIVTGMFSRYNILALGLSAASFSLEMTAQPSPTELFLMVELASILALKVAFDIVIKRREGAGQIRGIGEEGRRLDRLHQSVERMTLAVMVLSFGTFVLNLLPPAEGEVDYKK